MLKVLRGVICPLVSISFVVLVLVFMGSNPASAANSASFNANVKVRPSLTVNVTKNGAVASDVTLNLDPASNPYDSQNLDVAVSTNNKTGYVLTMSTANGSSNLTNVADDTKTIPTLGSAAGSTPSTLTDNTWGYKQDSGNYKPFVSGNSILSNSGKTNEDATTLSFAAKIDYTKPSGLYKQDLVFVATPNIVTYTMQDLDAAICTSDPIEATDLRDNQTYWVAELADGNCWMLQNLKLGNNLTATSGTKTLTPSDTNVSQNWVLSNKLTDGGMFPYGAILVDDVDGVEIRVYDGNAFYCAPDGTNSYVSCYYNWYTATAGKGTSNVTGKDDLVNGVDVNESICPKGWVIPSSGSASSTKNDYKKLYQAMGSPAATEMLVNPTTAFDNVNGASKPGFLLGGSYTATGYLSGGARYWSRTARSSTRGWVQSITSSVWKDEAYNVKREGLAVRCLRETRTLLDIDNMQDISPAIVGNTNIGAFKRLKDTRDNQYYTVGKLEDGNIWMLDNLNIDLFANKNVISPSNTHITGTVGINGLNAFNGTSVGTTSDRYATGAIASTNSDSSGNWTSSASFSVPLQNRSGTCDPSINTAYQCLTPYQNASYTYNKVIDKYGIPASDTSGTANITYNIGHGDYKIGTYYNYCAATLGSYCYGNGTTSGTATGNATEADICPLGWRMPTGGASGDFQNLCNAVNGAACSSLQSMNADSADSLQAKLSTPMSGRYYNGTSFRQGSYGYYISSTYYSATNMYDMIPGGTAVAPYDTDNRSRGFSVRCLAR